MRFVPGFALTILSFLFILSIPAFRADHLPRPAGERRERLRTELPTALFFLIDPRVFVECGKQIRNESS